MTVAKASRIVKLKPDPHGEHGAIRLRRVKRSEATDPWNVGSAESPFIVEHVDSVGNVAIQTMRGFADYAAALKCADEVAQRLRIPVRNETGVSPDKPAKAVRDALPSLRAAPSNSDNDVSEYQVRMDAVIKSRADRGRGKALVAILDEADAIEAYTPSEIEQLSKAWIAALPNATRNEIHLATGIVATRMRAFAALENMAERILALESQLAEKSAHAMIYRGVWREEGSFDQGSVVTFGGSLWHANKTTNARPGDDHEAWTLCVKKGRDGRDAAP